MNKKATVTKKAKKPQATKPTKTVKPTKVKATAQPKTVCGKGKKPQVKATKPVKATAQPKVTKQAKVTKAPKAPKIAKAPRRTVRIAGDTYHAKGKQLYEIPAESTLKRLKKQGVKRMQWANGDTLIIK